MSEQKFDNGDWRIEKFDSGGIRLNCNGRCLAKLEWTGKILDADRIEANFQLMSASPEGIKAAIEVRKFILGLYREGIADALEITKVVDKLEKYIAKAIDIKDWSELEGFHFDNIADIAIKKHFENTDKLLKESDKLLSESQQSILESQQLRIQIPKKDYFVRLEIPPTEDDGSCRQTCGLRYYDDCGVRCFENLMLINEEYPEDSNTKSDIPGPKCPRYNGDAK